MKKNIIVVAAVCLLSAACAKEVQPQAESQGSASGGYIEVSVAQTKIANAGLKATIIGKGDKVVAQVPDAGQTIEQQPGKEKTLLERLLERIL